MFWRGVTEAHTNPCPALRLGRIHVKRAFCMEVNRIYHGDAFTVLKTLPEDAVNCCVTSPPYWGLRQYLFDKAVVVRYDLPHEEHAKIEAELHRRGIKPRL